MQRAVASGGLRADLARFLAEDVGRGDVTTEVTVAAGVRARGRLVAKETLVVAGLGIALAVFQELDARVGLARPMNDGQAAGPGEILGELVGPAQAILTGERVALNLLQRLSAITTRTRRFVEAIRGTRARIVDTERPRPGSASSRSTR